MSGLWTVTSPGAGPELGRVAVLTDEVDLVAEPRERVARLAL